MYPPTFDYYRASSVNEAIALKMEHPGAKFLAGGHSLIPILNLRLDDPGVIIDIGRLDELKGIKVTRGGGVTIGALTTHTEVAAHPDMPTVLAEAAGIIGDPQVRNRGTVGGNVAHADPASDLPTVFTALKATFEVASAHGSRSVAADDFFMSMFETAILPGEILHSINVSSLKPGRMFNESAGSAYAKLGNPASRYAMVGAAAVLAEEGGVCSYASVAVGGLTPKATRASSVEAALLGKPLNADNIATAAEAVQNDLGDEILGDIHASADYRRAMVTVYLRRALSEAAENAGPQAKGRSGS